LEGWSGSVNLHDVRTSVPEPSTIALFLTALAGMLGLRRRKVEAGCLCECTYVHSPGRTGERSEPRNYDRGHH
jgi:hypothetical protein